MPRSLIEQWFPAQSVGAESLRERGASSALPPINFLHVWWARRPLTASRAAVLATVLPAWPSEREAAADPILRELVDTLGTEFPGGVNEYHAWFLRTLGILGDPAAGRARIKAANARQEKLKDNGYGYARAFTVTPDDENLARIKRLARAAGAFSEPPVVLDPFAGGGSIPFEASRFGFAAIANELNPVATAILHGTVELPATLGPDFAKVIDRYGKRWSDAVARRLTAFFPKEVSDAAIVGYIWAHTVPCPTTGRPTPLAPNLWLARDSGPMDFAVRLEPDPSTGRVVASVVEGERAKKAGAHSLHQAKKNAASSTILLTCRKRADIRDEVATTVREAVASSAAAGLTGIDLTLSTFGPALAVLSRRWPVKTGELGEDGQPEVIRPDVALDLAREEVARLKKRGLLGGRDVEFDRVTDWYLLAWSDFGAASFPAGEALKLSIATHLDLDDLIKTHRVIRTASGDAVLLAPAERRAAKKLDPAAASWPTRIDALHALMLTYEEDGPRAVRSWLERTRLGTDTTFIALFTAALKAIPRTKDKGEFIRPEARALEGLRATVFDSIPAPAEAELPAEQLGLIE